LAEDPTVVPWEIVVDTTDQIYLIDLWQRRVAQWHDSSLRTVFPQTDTGAVYYRLSQGARGSLLTTDETYVFNIAPDGSVLAALDSAVLSWSQRLWRSIGWFGLALLLILTALCLWRLYVDVLNRRLPLLLKQFLTVVPLVVMSIFALSHWIIQDFLRLQGQQSIDKVMSLAQTIALQVDGDLVRTVQNQSDYMNEAYRQIRTNLHQALNGNRDPWNEGYYFALYRVLNDKLYGFMYLNDYIGILHPFTWFEEDQSLYRLAYAGEIGYEQVADETGDWLYGVAPVYDRHGQVAALLEVGTDQYSLMQSHRDLYFKALKLIAAITMPLVLLLTMMTYAVLRALRRLRDAVEQISRGEWEARVRTDSRDEVADLAQNFNRMADYVSRYMNEIEALNRSYRRFVPEQFLRYLDKPSVLDVQLGDQVQREMTVLFCDIRGFTSISEQMTPKENFDFLNAYLSLLGPCVRMHNGFIDKYIGDAIMALFPQRADDAVAAAIAMTQALQRFNDSRPDLPPLKVGMGIHTGLLMLGILGEQERLEGTVIADSVNLASRLEYLTKHYGATVIISAVTYQNLSQADEYCCRYLGKVNVIGKQNAMGIYEVIDAEGADNQAPKRFTHARLEQAIKAYEARRLDEAQGIFAEILKHHEDDKTAKLYWQSCIALLQQENNPEEAWNGAIKFNSK
jgi:adenylate cyclase